MYRVLLLIKLLRGLLIGDRVHFSRFRPERQRKLLKLLCQRISILKTNCDSVDSLLGYVGNRIILLEIEKKNNRKNLWSPI